MSKTYNNPAVTQHRHGGLSLETTDYQHLTWGVHSANHFQGLYKVPVQGLPHRNSFKTNEDCDKVMWAAVSYLHK